MGRIECDFNFNHGFTCGLMKVAEQFSNGLLDDIRRHKLQITPTRMHALMDCMILNRAILRENPDAFVRVNKEVPGCFEVYVPKRR